MQEIGHNVHNPSVSMHLENILKSNWRLPAPSNCPPEVRCPCHFPAFTYPYTNILYTYDNFLVNQHCWIELHTKQIPLLHWLLHILLLWHQVYGLMKQCWAYNFEERPCFSSLGKQIETIMQEERDNLKGWERSRSCTSQLDMIEIDRL